MDLRIRAGLDSSLGDNLGFSLGGNDDGRDRVCLRLQGGFVLSDRLPSLVGSPSKPREGHITFEVTPVLVTGYPFTVVEG